MVHNISYLFLLFLLGMACVPATNYVRTAHISAPSGETLTLPMHEKIELSGGIAFIDTHPSIVFPKIYLLGDPLVSPSNWAFNLLARFSVHSNIAIGLQGSAELAPQRNYLMLPYENGVVWGIGPNISAHFHPWSPNFTIGISFAANLSATPWNVWERTSPPGNFSTILFDASQYQKREHGTDFLIITRTSAGASYLLEEHVEFFGGLSMQNTAKNIGFDNTAQNGSTLTADVINLVPFFGVGILFKPFFARLQGFVPISTSRHDDVYVGTLLQMGGTF